MANTIKLKRGLSVNVDSLNLQPGEVAIVLDVGTLKFGDEDGNVRDITVESFLEAGDHISITDGKVINVLDVGILTELNTEDKSTLVQAINETLATTQDINNNVVVLKTNVEGQIAQIIKRLDQLDGGSAETTITTLVNSLITIRESDGIQMGNEASTIKTSMSDDFIKFQNSGQEIFGIRTNTVTGEVQTFCEALNAGAVLAGVHERKDFIVNGEKRTGFFYTDGGEG